MIHTIFLVSISSISLGVAVAQQGSEQVGERRLLIVDALGRHSESDYAVIEACTQRQVTDSAHSQNQSLAEGSYFVSFADSAEPAVPFRIEAGTRLIVLQKPSPMIEIPKLPLRSSIFGTISPAVGDVDHLRVRLVALAGYEVFDAPVSRQGHFSFVQLRLGAYQLLAIWRTEVVASRTVQLGPEPARVSLRWQGKP